jgi:2-polyprenyl-3-methyl-5-hydroxy-6-metoxy-1,4-benzoquinol methylase
MLSELKIQAEEACTAFDWQPEDMGKQYDTIPPHLYEAMMDRVRYRELEEICETVKTLNFPTTAEIIDIGAGTGRAGRFLMKEGFINIDAIDASERYVESLKATGAYRKSHHLYLGQGSYPFEEQKDHYDLVISAGVWLPGHIPCEGMAEVVDCMKPGALWVLAMRTRYYTVGEPEKYREGLDALVAAGKIELTQSRTFMRGDPDATNVLWQP